MFINFQKEYKLPVCGGFQWLEVGFGIQKHKLPHSHHQCSKLLCMLSKHNNNLVLYIIEQFVLAVNE